MCRMETTNKSIQRINLIDQYERKLYLLYEMFSCWVFNV